MLRSLAKASSISKAAFNPPRSISAARAVRFNSTIQPSGQSSTNTTSNTNNTNNTNSTITAPAASTPTSSLGTQAKVGHTYGNGGNGSGNGRKRAGILTQLKRVTYATLLVGAGTFAYGESRSLFFSVRIVTLFSQV